MKENREEYQNEKEKREKRLLAYADMIQSAVQQDSSEVIRTRIPTLLMLEKYANALGKHIEVSIRDKE